MPDEPRTAVLQFDSVSDSRGLLKELSLRVDSGEAVGLLAHPASALRELSLLAAGIEFPASGKVTTLGVLSQELSTEKRARLGYLAERNGLLRSQRLGQQVVSSARTCGLNAREAFEAACKIIEELGITRHADKYPQTVGKSERRLFALACAMCVERDLLLLHSPARDLAPEAASVVLKKLVTLSRAGTAVLVLTEQAEVIEGICDRAVFISGGRVVAADTPEKLCESCETDEVLIVPRGIPNTAQMGFGQHKFIRSVRRSERGFELAIEGGSANLPALLETIAERDVELEAVTYVRSRLASAFEQFSGGRK